MNAFEKKPFGFLSRFRNLPRSLRLRYRNRHLSRLSRRDQDTLLGCYHRLFDDGPDALQLDGRLPGEVRIR